MSHLRPPSLLHTHTHTHAHTHTHTHTPFWAAGTLPSYAVDPDKPYILPINMTPVADRPWVDGVHLCVCVYGCVHAMCVSVCVCVCGCVSCACIYAYIDLTIALALALALISRCCYVRVRRGFLTSNLYPYTLNPTPYTLHFTPYTLRPTPYTLHPAPYTLHPTPSMQLLRACEERMDADKLIPLGKCHWMIPILQVSLSRSRSLSLSLALSLSRARALSLSHSNPSGLPSLACTQIHRMHS